jgi:hypothetical protein
MFHFGMYSSTSAALELALFGIPNEKRNIMNNKITRLALATTSLCAAAALVACGGGSSSTPTPTPTPTMGSVKVSVMDAPACGFDEVNVTISKVRVHQSATAADTDGGWTDIVVPAHQINLLSLTNGVMEVLGTAPLAAGHYTQVRLVLDANTGNNMVNNVVPTGGTKQNLDTPSAVQSGIKLIGAFDVAAGQQADVMLDFDACKSIVTKGNGKYALKPVVKMIPVLLNGIGGVISPTMLANHVMISAQQNGVVIGSTVPAATTGDFFVSHLPAGNYDLVITADGSAASVIGAVPVAATGTTAVSTTAAPLTLATSLTGSIAGTVTLAPVSTTEAGYVAAKQSFAAGPTVTIKYAGADLLTGAYTIANLPLNAPQYAVYSATLPLAFAPATTVLPGVGKYNVDASAVGYTLKPFATPVDISAANATNINFTLVP